VNPWAASTRKNVNAKRLATLVPPDAGTGAALQCNMRNSDQRDALWHASRWDATLGLVLDLGQATGRTRYAHNHRCRHRSRPALDP